MLINHVFGAKSYIAKLSEFYFYRLLYGAHFITQKLLDHFLWNKKQNEQKTFLLLLTDFLMLKMKYLFVSLFSVVSTQNLRLEIPTLRLQ